MRVQLRNDRGDDVTDSGVDLYLDLLKRCVTNVIYQDRAIAYLSEDAADGVLNPFSMERRITGKDWPSQAHTMIGIHRLDNIEMLVRRILTEAVPGDLIEAGVWRGGSTIFMRGLLKAHGVTNRTVWVADSFGGHLPTAENGASDRSYSSPSVQPFHDALLRGGALPPAFQERLDLLGLGTSHGQVRERFTRYGLLDDQVRFLVGWFRDSLPAAPIERLALLRLDADFYDSTLDAIGALYPKLSPGGYVIVDDYGTFPECRAAIHDFLADVGEVPRIIPIDDDAVFWEKSP